MRTETMGQKLMCPKMPAGDTHAEVTVDMRADESMLILIKHCRDMKQQETSLRVITLLLLLTCTSLFFISTCTDLRQRRDQSSNHAAVESPAYSKQDKLCPADPKQNSQTETSKTPINLKSVRGNSSTEPLYLTWTPIIGVNYNKENRSIVIPTTGIYFVYMKFDLRCYENKTGVFKSFRASLHFWNKAYKKVQPLAEEQSGVECFSERSRSVFVGQLYDLLEGDHLSVWITQGYGLIWTSSFGAFQV